MSADSIQPISRQRLGHRVAGALRRLIIEQGMEPGQRLPAERDLSNAMAVSRHVLREALRQLESEGIIVSSHGNGTFVQRIPVEPVTDLAEESSDSAVKQEARTVFEAGLADLIIERATEDDIEKLARIVAEMRVQVVAGRPAGMEDVQFHEQILRSTHNEELIRIGKTLIVGFLRQRLLAAELIYAPESVDLEPHETIVAAIAARDAETLRRCLRDHGYPPNAS